MSNVHCYLLIFKSFTCLKQRKKNYVVIVHFFLSFGNPNLWLMKYKSDIAPTKIQENPTEIIAPDVRMIWMCVPPK